MSVTSNEMDQALRTLGILNQEKIEGLRDVGAGIYKSLVGTQDNRHIPERIFVEYFLPYFAGEIPITKDSTVMADWVSVAGSPINEVDVVGHTGDVLFTVPSLMDTSVIDPLKRDATNGFLSIYGQYEMRSNNLPIMGEAFIAKAMIDKVEDMVEPSAKAAIDGDRWSHILHRYGKGMEMTSSTDIQDDPSDDLDYD